MSLTPCAGLLPPTFTTSAASVVADGDRAAASGAHRTGPPRFPGGPRGGRSVSTSTESENPMIDVNESLAAKAEQTRALMASVDANGHIPPPEPEPTPPAVAEPEPAPGPADAGARLNQPHRPFDPTNLDRLREQISEAEIARDWSTAGHLKRTLLAELGRQ